MSSLHCISTIILLTILTASLFFCSMHITNTTPLLNSDAFPTNGTIPVRYTCDGEGVLPPFSWANVPEATRSFTVILEDPDAPIGTYTHWVLYNIPGERRELPAGISPERDLPGGESQGMNSARKTEYACPCPLGGATHRYILTV